MSSPFLQFNPKSKSKSATTRRGFGLIELIVSISIMLIVLAVILVRHSSFNGAVLLRNQAYEIALDTRETQLNAVSAVGSGAGNNFRASLGVYFDTTRNDTYRIYRDADGDKSYDCTVPGAPTCEEFGLQNTLDKRFEIRAIRVIGASMTGTGLSVVFERPNYDARFFDSAGPVAASSIQIDIGKRGMAGSSGDAIRTVEVTATGQVTVL